MLEHERRVAIGIKTRIEFCRVEFYLGGVDFQLVKCKRADIFAVPFGKQLVLEFPKLVLLVCAFCAVRRPMRLADFALVDHREVFVRIADLAGLDVITLNARFHIAPKLPAVRALEIGIDNQRHFGIGIAFGPAVDDENVTGDAAEFGGRSWKRGGAGAPGEDEV